MKNFFFAFILFPFFGGVHGQIKENIYELQALDNLLTDEVKNVIDQNIAEKHTVFLGEAVHYSGSDFLAKAEFVKYLVKEHGYKDIAFESDFFGLLFQHYKGNLFKMWSLSEQCKPLMAFLKENNVTIWGFDNQMHSYYTHKEFTNKLSSFLKSNNIEIDQRFFKLTDTLIKKGYDSSKTLSKEEITFLDNEVWKLIKSEKTQADPLWKQVLESYRSTIELYTIKDNYSSKNAIPIRDKQMAKNLDFLIKRNPNKKFIVWLANGHMSKCNHDYMNGQTMGFQFREINPNTSYHIAFGSIKMPPERTEKSIIKASKDSNSILSFLPSLAHNYFLDANKAISETPELNAKMFKDAWIFNLHPKKVALLSHFDALIFISEGIEVSYSE